MRNNKSSLSGLMCKAIIVMKDTDRVFPMCVCVRTCMRAKLTQTKGL